LPSSLQDAVVECVVGSKVLHASGRVHSLGYRIVQVRRRRRRMMVMM
jgi:hypothetical protein